MFSLFNIFPNWYFYKAKALLITAIILDMGSANESQRYNVTSSLIGWTHTQNEIWICVLWITSCNIRHISSSYVILAQNDI